MKKKNTFLGVALLIAVLVLGIGYALTAGPLQIDGTATAQQSATSFKVIFSDVTPGTQTTDDEDNVLTQSTANINADDATKADMNVTLTNVGESQTVTFEVKNDSQAGLTTTLDPAKIHVYLDGTDTEWTSEYFDIQIGGIDAAVELDSQETTTFTVTVTLLKAVLGESHTEEFDVVIDALEATATVTEEAGS